MTYTHLMSIFDTKVLSLLPENTDDIGIDTQWLYYNLGIGLAYVGEWSTCFSVLGSCGGDFYLNRIYKRHLLLKWLIWSPLLTRFLILTQTPRIHLNN